MLQYGGYEMDRRVDQCRRKTEPGIPVFIGKMHRLTVYARIKYGCTGNQQSMLQLKHRLTVYATIKVNG